MTVINKHNKDPNQEFPEIYLLGEKMFKIEIWPIVICSDYRKKSWIRILESIYCISQIVKTFMIKVK